MLFLGTEHGVYLSFDEGNYWQSLSLNLPDVPVTGIAVKENDVVISTHGRSFWVLDDIETLRQLELEIMRSGFHLFKPADAIRRVIPAVVDYYVKEPNHMISVEILDTDAQKVRILHEGRITKSGMHRLKWDLRYSGATVFPNIILEGGNPAKGPWASPGRYQVRLVMDGEEQKQWFNLKKDPRLTDVTEADLRAQFELAMKIRDSESAANQGVILIRELRSQIENRMIRTDDPKLSKMARTLITKISAVEKELYQVKNQSPKDKIAFSIKLNDRLTGLRSHLEMGDGRPTQAYYQVFEELRAELETRLDELERILHDDMPRLNNLLRQSNIDQIQLPIKVRR